MRMRRCTLVIGYTSTPDSNHASAHLVNTEVDDVSCVCARARAGARPITLPRSPALKHASCGAPP